MSFTAIYSINYALINWQMLENCKIDGEINYYPLVDQLCWKKHFKLIGYNCHIREWDFRIFYGTTLTTFT
jgi:hypothetical protein